MSDSTPRPLENIRKEIDSLDAELVRLLSRRAELAIEVGKVKGLDGKPFFTPEREREIHQRLRDSNPGPLQQSQLEAIFREIISAARAAEQPLRVAYWGPAGSFSNMAAIQTFGSSTTTVPCESIQEVFHSVERGEADYGVVPIENSTAGVVPETLDMFPQTNIKVCAETNVSIHHYLLTSVGELKGVRRVYAGPQPANQCRRWLRANLPNAEIVETMPTSRAIERAKSDPEGAAIGNKLGAELSGLTVLADRIEDNPHNTTRFIVLGYNEPARTGRDKTSIMFNLRNRPGELYNALGAFKLHGVNLTMIESRPAQRAEFEYIFYCDCSGHRQDTHLKLAMEDLRACALEATILGSYPDAETR